MDPNHANHDQAGDEAELTFEELGIDPAIIAGLHDLSYQVPFQVQVSCLNPIRQGRHISVRSRTGTGKTAAFGIPLLERIDATARKPELLVLAPTRELAAQISAELEAIGRHRQARVVAAYGGAAIGPQIEALRAGAQVVVGTPGRLLDLVERRVLDLGSFQTVVLDEADEMLSMGFYEDVTRLMDGCTGCRQVVILSASLSEDTSRLIDKYAPDVVRIDLSEDRLSVEGTRNIYYVIGDRLPRHHYLLHVLAVEKPSSAIVFVNTRSDAAVVVKVMAQEGLQAEMISGALPQKERERVMNSIRSGELRFLVATDLAARGIDISNLSHVINYSLPEDPTVFLHRVGRTGRVGKEGTAVSLVSGRRIHTLSLLQRRFGVRFEERRFPPKEQMVEERTTAQVRELAEVADAIVSDGFLTQAKAVLAHERATQIVSYLLKRHADRVHDERRSTSNRPKPQPEGKRGRPRGRRRPHRDRRR